MPWAGIAGAAAGAVGSIFGSSLDFYSAQKNRDWQEYMSNTAHQREVADLRKAGLNPILSAIGGHGASTPTGSVTNVSSSLGEAGKSLGKIFDKQYRLQNQKLQEEIKKERALTLQANALEDNARADALLKESQVIATGVNAENALMDLDAKKLKYVYDSAMTDYLFGGEGSYKGKFLREREKDFRYLGSGAHQITGEISEKVKEGLDRFIASRQRATDSKRVEDLYLRAARDSDKWLTDRDRVKFNDYLREYPDLNEDQKDVLRRLYFGDK